VLLLEDDEVVRRRIASDLAAFNDLVVVGAAPSIRTARQVLGSTDVDIAVMDLNLADGTTRPLIKEITARGVAVLILTAQHDDASVYGALRAGAGGYLLRQESHLALGSALRLLRDGGAPISPRIARRLLEDLRGPQVATAEALTARELELVGLFSKGVTYGEVADILGLSVNTVRSHVRNLYDKLHVSSKAEAVARVMHGSR
jgi:DNA-binding NarL/FixJ family response regulator